MCERDAEGIALFFAALLCEKKISIFRFAFVKLFNLTHDIRILPNIMNEIEWRFRILLRKLLSRTL